MSTREQLPFPWTPITAPTPVTPARPRRNPARGDRPTAPHPLRALPPRVLPAPDAAPEVAVGPAPASVIEAVGDSPANAADAFGIALSAAAAARHGVALHKQDTVRTLLALDSEELAALVGAGVILEIALGAGILRYAFAEEVPAAFHERRAA